MQRRQAGWIALFLMPTAALFLIIYAVPLGMTLFTSLFDYRLFPNRMDFVGLGNFVQLLARDAQFHRALVNNLVWILLHATLHIAIGAVLALILHKKPRGWKAVRVIYMIPSIISNAAVAMIFANIYNPSYGVINSFLKSAGLAGLQRNWLYDPATSFVSITMIWTLFSGYNTTLILSQALSLDDSVIEAAKVDGASRLQQDFLIVLPLVRHMLATTMIMAATYMLQMFDLIYLTTRGGPGVSTTNLPLMLYKTAMTENNYGYANTLGVVVIALGVLFMTLINKLLRTRED